MEDQHTNGTTPVGTICPGRKQDGALHCWHTMTTPIPNPGTGSVLFPNLCCFCAPTYFHIDVLVHPDASDDVIVASQMQHGHLITIKRQQRQQRGPSLMVPRG